MGVWEKEEGITPIGNLGKRRLVAAGTMGGNRADSPMISDSYFTPGKNLAFDR